MQLSLPQKYRLCQIIFAVGFVVTIFWLAHMSPWAGSHHNMLMFVGVAVTVIITIPFALGFYYYRSKLRDADAGLAAIRKVEVEALSHAGQAVKDVPTRSDEQRP